MDSREAGEELELAGTPDDVAVLYAWANLHGAKYRDFSASRREYRAQVRYRAANQLRERELLAQAEAEAAAAAAERAAQAAEAAAKAAAESPNGSDGQAMRLQALRNAEAAARKAAAERVEAARRGDAAAKAALVAKREEREIAEAHASAQRQAQSYTESEARRRQLAGPQPHTPIPGQMADPYTPFQPNATWEQQQEADAPGYLPSGRFNQGIEDSATVLNLSRDAAPLWRPQGYRPDDASGVWQIDRPGSASAEKPPVERTQVDRIEEEKSGPAWLYAPQTPPPVRTPSRAPVPVAPPPVSGDTLQDSRERVAARWFALKGVFEHAAPELPALQLVRTADTRTPVLMAFSLAGGVGKTSLVATLGRALSSRGERVVLTDTTSHGLLPFYFGARELRPGVVRTFSPPENSDDAPISLVSYDLQRRGADDRQQELLAEDIFRNGAGNQRVIVDLSADNGWLIRRMADHHPVVLIPMSPDMNSVIGMQAMERFFQGIADSEGRPLLPFYVLNQFDATLPLHLDVREVFRRQLGERLLRYVIRRSPAVSEALAEGMTVVDYAPAAPVSKDYRDVASWLTEVSPIAAASAPDAAQPPGWSGQ
jgi:cellulose synthase operon protein YhjQ